MISIALNNGAVQ